MPREPFQGGGPGLEAEAAPPQLGLVQEVYFSDLRARVARPLNSHAHHHAALRNTHCSFVNQQDVHPVWAIQKGAASLNINE